MSKEIERLREHADLTYKNYLVRGQEIAKLKQEIYILTEALKIRKKVSKEKLYEILQVEPIPVQWAEKIVSLLCEYLEL